MGGQKNIKNAIGGLKRLPCSGFLERNVMMLFLAISKFGQLGGETGPFLGELRPCSPLFIVISPVWAPQLPVSATKES
jgi:hypothetical protein